MGTNHVASGVEEFVAAGFTKTMNEGRVDAVEEYFSETLDYHRSSGELAGRRELRGDIETFHAAFPDLRADISRIMSQDDKVSFLYTLSGTHEAEFEGIPPTGQEMAAKGAAIAHVTGDSISEYRIVYDNLGMREDLGLIK
ncbi:ester cyclase [Salinibaculum salinum]|uniref:ester cyclase n=1 Tax=Salinibaculum salinum TaxID=3131996 RepID=UPI0030EF071C